MIELPCARGRETLAHHLHDARAIAAAQLDVLVEPHVPADARDLEVLDLRHPFVVREQPEQHEDVEQRQVIGDHHVGFVARDLLAPEPAIGQAGFAHV